MAGGPTDHDLIAAARAGDHAAFERLYRRHRDWAVAVALRFCGNREDALDAAQEAFLYVLRKLPKLTLTARFTTFLYPALKHLALDRRRKARRHPPLDGAAEPTHLPAFGAGIEDLLEGLSALQREILGLRFTDGLDLNAIAEALGIPLGTVKSRLHNALKALKEKHREE